MTSLNLIRKERFPTLRKEGQLTQILAMCIFTVFLVPKALNANSGEKCQEQTRLHQLQQLGTSKYLYYTGSKIHSQQMNWNDGNHYCIKSGYRFSTIKNTKEFDELELELLQLPGRTPNSGTEFWIGATTNDSVSIFQDKTPVPFEVEPGNRSFGCVMLKTKKYLTEMYLQSNNCLEKCGIICEFKPEDVNCFSRPVGLEKNREAFENMQSTHLYYSSIKKSWSSALEFCEQNGMQLLSIQTAEINGLIYKTIANHFGFAKIVRFWTSGNFWFSPPPGMTRLGWMTTGELASSDFPLESTWKKGQPSGNTYDKCVDVEFISDDVNKTMKWQVSNCDQALNFICREPDPCHYFQDDDSGYLFRLGHRQYFFSYNMHTWMDSIEYCRNNGMDLLALEMSTENTLVAFQIATKLKELDMASIAYWSSGTDLGQRNHFIWLTTGRPIGSTEMKLIKSSANQVHGTEHCLLVHVKGKFDKNNTNEEIDEVHWEDADCSLGNYFVCEERKDCSIC